MAVNGVKNTFTNNCVYRFYKKTVNNAEQAFFDKIPTKVVGEKADKFCKTVGREISSAENRLILGVSALLSQPFIDYNNNKINDDTKRVAVCRTIAKIVAGTATGYLVRKGTIKGIEYCSQAPSKNMPKWRTIFTPNNIKNVNTEAFKQYRNALGTFVSLGVMLFTNFAIDAPLTKFLTNNLNAKVQEKCSERRTK